MICKVFETSPFVYVNILEESPGRGSKIVYGYTIEQHSWQVSENHKPRIHPNNAREIG